MNKDKKELLAASGALALLAIAAFALYLGLNNAQQRLSLIESVYREISSNRAGLIAMSEETKLLLSRAVEGRDRNFVSEVEKIAAGTGLSKKLKKIQFLTQRQDGRFKGDDYDLRLEGLDINEAVNFIYRVSNAGALVKIRKCSLTVSFENPALLNISLLVSHIT